MYSSAIWLVPVSGVGGGSVTTIKVSALAESGATCCQPAGDTDQAYTPTFETVALVTGSVCVPASGPNTHAASPAVLPVNAERSAQVVAARPVVMAISSPAPEMSLCFLHGAETPRNNRRAAWIGNRERT